MAGSLSHIINDDGTFTMDFIENMGDAHEALDECFRVIYALSNGGDMNVINAAAVTAPVAVAGNVVLIERNLVI